MSETFFLHRPLKMTLIVNAEAACLLVSYSRVISDHWHLWLGDARRDISSFVSPFSLTPSTPVGDLVIDADQQQEDYMESWKDWLCHPWRQRRSHLLETLSKWKHLFLSVEIIPEQMINGVIYLGRHSTVGSKDRRQYFRKKSIDYDGFLVSLDLFRHFNSCTSTKKTGIIYSFLHQEEKTISILAIE